MSPQAKSLPICCSTYRHCIHWRDIALPWSQIPRIAAGVPLNGIRSLCHYHPDRKVFRRCQVRCHSGVRLYVLVLPSTPRCMLASLANLLASKGPSRHRDVVARGHRQPVPGTESAKRGHKARCVAQSVAASSCRRCPLRPEMRKWIAAGRVLGGVHERGDCANVVASSERHLGGVCLRPVGAIIARDAEAPATSKVAP